LGRAVGDRIGRDHRGVVFSELIGALAHLGLARAYTLEGENAKAHTAY
jgi:hypothetical protein